MDTTYIEHRFTYHPPTPEQAEKYQEIRDEAKRFALRLNALCPDSCELATALTHLDGVVFFANAAIAREQVA